MADFGDAYKINMDNPDEWGESRVHVETIWKKPTELYVGEWAMYLPIEVTEQMGMVPRMSRITRIHFQNGDYIIATELGIMVIKAHQMIQVVT